MKIAHTLSEILRNVFVGLRVLFAELYWLAGPDWTFRRARRKQCAAIEACRAKSGSGDPLLIQAELDVLEAELAMAQTHQDARRARHLEDLRRNCGIA